MTLSAYPHAAAKLPLSLIRLQDWALSTIQGVDSDKYLQGQITADVLQLNENQHILAAHCDAKGKMWSTMRLFRHQQGFAWITRRSLQATQLGELKKYAVFSKVSIDPDHNAVLLGIAGQGARAALAAHFPHMPDQQTPLTRHSNNHNSSHNNSHNNSNNNSVLLWLPWPDERFLLITDSVTAQHLTDQLQPQARLTTSDQWLALDIEAGYPLLDTASCQQFIPQACNLQALGGISFKKGCYSGQEMVARAKFRGANKRALWCLQGDASRLPAVGEDLELQLGDNWRRTGSVLAAVRLATGESLIQAVLNNDLAADSVLRVRASDAAGDNPPDSQLSASAPATSSDNLLHIRPLPYPLQEPA